MKHLGTGEITTPRLLLRRFSPADAPAMYQNWAADPRVSRHMFWEPFESEAAVRATLLDWQTQYQNQEFYRWGLVEKSSGALIGSMGLANFGTDAHPRWEPAYNIGYDFWGHGYSAEALCAVAEYFWDTGAAALYAAHAEANPASGRVLEKAGFQYRNKDAYHTPDGTLVPALYYRKKRPMPRHVGTRRVETPRLLLRRFVMEDVPALFKTWAGDAEITQYMRWPTHENEAETRQVLASWVDAYPNSQFYNWAVEEKETGLLAGSVGIVPSTEDGKQSAWEPGYSFGRSFWGKGYATEALCATMEEFTRCTGIDNLWACRATGNPASGRVLEKAGFVLAHSGEYTCYDGSRHPAFFYQYRPQEACNGCAQPRKD